MIATRTTSPGQVRSPIRWPTVGLLAGSVISTRLVAPSWKVSNRTRSPTVTASSTRADISRGVDTATSTPQTSLNIHSFFGWLTRATVRGTPNSVLASSDTTRLTLSSPVAAMATSQVSSPASSNEDSSQASASSHSTPSVLSVLIACGSLSISSTSWPFSTSSVAMDRPTFPAPAMATRTPGSSFRRSCRPRWCGEHRLDLSQLLIQHGSVKQVAVLEERAARGDCAAAHPEQERHSGAGRILDMAHRAAHPGSVDVHLHQPNRTRRIPPVRFGAPGQQAPQHLVGCPAHGSDGGDAEP